MNQGNYTTKLGAGFGIIEETYILLDLWQEGMSPTELYRAALASGQFPNITARRLKNIVIDAFAPRYLVENAKPARLLKSLKNTLSRKVFEQLLFLYTARANLILADFVREIYWPSYAAGHDVIANTAAREFVMRAVEEGKTTTVWSDETVERVAQYLTRTLADFGLLESGAKRVRRILPYWIESETAVFLAFDLHAAGIGDNGVIHHPDWRLFGMEWDDVLNELKKMVLRDLLIVQVGGGVIKIDWLYETPEEALHVIT